MTQSRLGSWLPQTGAHGPLWVEEGWVKIIVTKPKDGRVTVTLDDRRGLTGRVQRLPNVLVEEMDGLVMARLEAWEATRKRVKDAKKTPVG